MKRSKIAYIHPNDDGKPCMSMGSLLNEVAEGAFGDIKYFVSPRARKGSRKVRITVTVEAEP